MGGIWRSLATAGQKNIPKGRARPQQGRKTREGKGKAKNPSHPALSSKGGQEAAPGSEEARWPGVVRIGSFR